LSDGFVTNFGIISEEAEWSTGCPVKLPSRRAMVGSDPMTADAALVGARRAA
jgi:hypothetical protein